MTCSIGGGFTCSPSPFTITAGDPNPDAQILSGGFPILDIDFMDGWVDITPSPGGLSGFFGTSSVLTLSGLTPANGSPTELRSLSINNVTSLTAGDFALSGGC